MFNPTSYNPAYVGMSGLGSVSFLYRNQWTGYATTFDGAGGAPETQLLTLEVPVNFPGISGIGFNASNDHLGLENNIQLNFPIAGAYSFGSSTLRFGLMPGVYIKNINGDRLDPNDPNDPLIPRKEAQLKPDLGFGVLYETSNGLNLGLSMLHSLEPVFDLNLNSLKYLQKRSFILHGRKEYELGKNMTLLPSIIVRSDLSTFTFDAGALLLFPNQLWTGFSYRLEEALITYIGYNFLESKLKVGYSFDYIVHDQNAKNPTSHEIFIRYMLPDFVIGGRKSVKTPRFSY